MSSPPPLPMVVSPPTTATDDTTETRGDCSTNSAVSTSSSPSATRTHNSAKNETAPASSTGPNQVPDDSLPVAEEEEEVVAPVRPSTPPAAPTSITSPPKIPQQQQLQSQQSTLLLSATPPSSSSGGLVPRTSFRRAMTSFTVSEGDALGGGGGINEDPQQQSPKNRPIVVESLAPEVVQELERSFRTLQEENFITRRDHAYRQHYLNIMVREGMYQQLSQRQAYQKRMSMFGGGGASPSPGRHQQHGAPHSLDIIHPDPDAIAAQLAPSRQRVAEQFGSSPGRDDPSADGGKGGTGGAASSGAYQQHPIFLKPLAASLGDVQACLFRSGAVRIPPEMKLMKFISKAVKQVLLEEEREGSAAPGSSRRRFRSPADCPLTLQILLLIAEQMERASAVASCWLSHGEVSVKPRHPASEDDDEKHHHSHLPFAPDATAGSSEPTTGTTANLDLPAGFSTSRRRGSHVSIVSDSDDNNNSTCADEQERQYLSGGDGGRAAFAALRGVGTALIKFKRQLALEKRLTADNESKHGAPSGIQQQQQQQQQQRQQQSGSGLATLLAKGHQKQQRRLSISGGPKPPSGTRSMLAAGRKMHQKQHQQQQQQQQRQSAQTQQTQSGVSSLQRSDSFAFALTKSGSQSAGLLRALTADTQQQQQQDSDSEDDENEDDGDNDSLDSGWSGAGADEDMMNSTSGFFSGTISGGLMGAGGRRGSGAGGTMGHPTMTGDLSLDTPMFGLNYDEGGEASSTDDVMEKLRDIMRGAVSTLRTQRKHCTSWMQENGVDSRGKLKTAAVPSVVADPTSRGQKGAVKREGSSSFGDHYSDVDSVGTSASSRAPPLHFPASVNNSNAGGGTAAAAAAAHANDGSTSESARQRKSLSFAAGVTGGDGGGGSPDLLQSSTFGSFALDQLRREASSRSTLDDRALRPPKIWSFRGPVAPVIQTGSHIEPATLQFYRFVDAEEAKDEERGSRHNELFARLASEKRGASTSRGGRSSSSMSARGEEGLEPCPRRPGWCPETVHAPKQLSAREASSYERHVSQMRCRPPREIPRDFHLHAGKGSALALRDCRRHHGSVARSAASGTARSNNSMAGSTASAAGSRPTSARR